MRRRGSVLFDPYFKVQWFDPRAFAWRDVQRAFDSAEDARGHFVRGRECRVMMVTMQGRQVHP